MTSQSQFEQVPQRTPAAPVAEQGYRPPMAEPVGQPVPGAYPGQGLEVPQGLVPATPVGHSGVRVSAEERAAWSVPGGLALVARLLLGLVAVGLGAFGAVIGAPFVTVVGVLLFVAMYFGLTSLTVVQPGETKVLQFLGGYVGTIRKPGLQLTTPFTTKRRVSVKVNNFETHELKVNDSAGNPVNIAAIIVWQVSDTAKATFAVENSQHFVEVQAEAALRHVASTHPYDNADPGEESLRGSTELVAAELAQEVAARVAIAGIEIVEARISSLAYAPEIAHAMLQRQQAAAVIAARSMIVEGAVGMVEQALRRLETDSVVEMDEERKAQMVANLLLVLCGDSRATPVINTTQ
ncbi:MAG TPA: SPFH domain-containing protein [Propionibacteriaceae bacterium]|nr:SPFH domain-containing protein [Propionibacteriaceae bacterium]